MREIVLDIAKLGLNVADEINITLVDSVGNKYITDDGYSLDKNYVISNPIFKTLLYENDLISSDTHYKLSIPSSLTFNFKLNKDIENISHDLYYLLKMGCVKSIFDTSSPTLQLDKKFVENLNRYFTGEIPHFTSTQQAVVDMYEYYANEIIDTQRTIDVLKLIDNLLSQLKEI